MKYFISVYLVTKRRHIDIDKVESEPNKGYKVVLMLSGEKQVIDIRCRWERSIRVKRRNKASQSSVL